MDIRPEIQNKCKTQNSCERPRRNRGPGEQQVAHGLCLCAYYDQLMCIFRVGFGQATQKRQGGSSTGRDFIAATGFTVADLRGCYTQDFGTHICAHCWRQALSAHKKFEAIEPFRPYDASKVRASRHTFTSLAGEAGAAINKALMAQEYDRFAALALQPKSVFRRALLAKLEVEFRVEVTMQKRPL